jgi:hypothetical protein
MMKLTRILGAIIIGIMLCLPPAADKVCATSYEVRLNYVPYVFQEETNWCWAACSKMILDYHSIHRCYLDQNINEYEDIDLHRIAGHGTRGHNMGNLLTGSDYYLSVSRLRIQTILSFFGLRRQEGWTSSIATTEQSSALTFSQAVTEINAGRPFITRWGWNTGGGHFIVFWGYFCNDDQGYPSYPTGYIHDPWTGTSFVDFDWIAAGWHDPPYANLYHTWTHTLRLNSSPYLSVAGQNTSGSADQVLYPASPIQDPYYYGTSKPTRCHGGSWEVDFDGSSEWNHSCQGTWQCYDGEQWNDQYDNDGHCFY